MIKLKPCPFCGKRISYYIMDAEGNIHDESYLDDPSLWVIKITFII